VRSALEQGRLGWHGAARVLAAMAEVVPPSLALALGGDPVCAQAVERGLELLEPLRVLAAPGAFWRLPLPLGAFVMEGVDDFVQVLDGMHGRLHTKPDPLRPARQGSAAGARATASDPPVRRCPTDSPRASAAAPRCRSW